MVRALRVTGIVFAVPGLALSILGVASAYSDDPGPWANLGLACVSIAVVCALGAIISDRKDSNT
ncbi:hypothetical protein GCM10010413_06040 [Promicromonospora sukumoe]|uniref:Uncharacterized protein n=1 Tax=Promicromonospora sukumoe TaxID=88382 RepID=A0A7W3J4K6_9MICO|nr:hypothetical protein [Promicromonospora sukumoe]